jgi:hypothetical protein
LLLVGNYFLVLTINVLKKEFSHSALLQYFLEFVMAFGQFVSILPAKSQFWMIINFKLAQEPRIPSVHFATF